MPSKTPKTPLADAIKKLTDQGMLQQAQLNQYYEYQEFKTGEVGQLTGVTVYSSLRQPSPAPRKPKPMKPEYKVGDIIQHKNSPHHWEVLRVNAGSYRVERVDNNDHSRKSGMQQSWDFVHVHGMAVLLESAKPPKPPRAKIDFNTVIIADEKRQQINEALEQIHQADLIFTKWGFGDVMEKGKGVSILFYGMPGTGKTLMAQAIADKLDYELKVIGTADVESSAPGEAERNIRKHFKEAAEHGKTLLLFDECDSLLYNRANLGAIMSAQINELLSQIERYDGLTIFTTNRLGTLDEALNRRLALKLEFEMPTPSERAEIWRRMFPKKAPLSDDIDWLALAGVEITGGYIKNCVLRAARMAAAEKCANSKKQITMKHLVRALQLEAGSMADFEAAREADGMNYGHVAINGSHHTMTRQGGSHAVQQS